MQAFLILFCKIIIFPHSFCKTCAVVDPEDDKIAVKKITFATGCMTEICIVDLKVKSYGINPTFILGSSQTINITYEVTNSGDKAYMPQINITSSNKMSFYKIPPSCNHNSDYLVCDLSEGKPMLKNHKQNITIVYEIDEMSGTSINLTASVFCEGVELNPLDNFISDIITLKEFTEIEVIGKPNSTDIDLEKYTNSTAEIIYEFQVQSIGQSIIRELEIFIELPIAKQFYTSDQLIPVIDTDSIAIEGFYNDQQLLTNITIHQLENTNLTETRISFVEPKTENVVDQQISNNTINIDEAQKKNSTSKSTNRKIVFSTVDSNISTTMTAVMKVNDFIVNLPISIKVKYQVNLTEVNKILTEPWEFFEIVPNLTVVKTGDLNSSTINVKTNMMYLEILKHHLYIKKQTPFWLIALAVFGGILVFAAIVYGLQKVGFFKRITKEDMQRILQEKEDIEHFKEDIIAQLAKTKVNLEDEYINDSDSSECLKYEY